MASRKPSRYGVVTLALPRTSWGRNLAMTVQWKKDVDAALAEARSSGRHLLLDFNATPL
jgi:hypothetical protein